MTPPETAFVAICGLLYGFSVYVAAMLLVEGDRDPWDAPWWPIHLVKGLLKSLYRALFTGWRI